jgi:pyrroloquinoline-quinone synthase
VNANLWDRIEQARADHNVVEHPFYQRWSTGRLTREELAHYAGQYRYATEAIAKLSADISAHAPESERGALEAHAAEEADHVALWDGFVDAVGGTVGAEPNPETLECVEIWTRADGFGRQLARMFAIESGQPEISKTKTEGLGRHYEITDAPGNLYFTVHEEMDVRHAAEGRRLIERHMSDFSDDELVEAAEEAFEANWRLLDGVEKARS